MLAHLFVYEPTLTEIFFVQKVSCECWWDRRWFSGRVYGRWRRRSAVSYIWVSEHTILCESALCYASDPIYFLLVEKKGQATDKLQDRYGHVILPGELYLEGRYLHKSRSRHPSKKKLNVLDYTVRISPGETFETFVEFDDDLTMGNESYSKYLNFKVLYQYIFAW